MHGLLVFLLCVFALLVCNTAAGLASGLTRSLAFAAATLLSAFAKILCNEGFDTLHYSAILRFELILIDYITKESISQSNCKFFLHLRAVFDAKN